MSRSTQRLVCVSLPRLLASGDRLLRGAHFKDEVVQSIGRHFGAVLAFDGLAILFLQEAKLLDDGLEELVRFLHRDRAKSTATSSPTRSSEVSTVLALTAASSSPDIKRSTRLTFFDFHFLPSKSVSSRPASTTS